MAWAGDLRRELSVRGQQIAVMNRSLHELTAGEMPSVIFGRDENRHHGNFYHASWRNICANPEWAPPPGQGPHCSAPRRTARGLAVEGGSADALLMNVFCYRRRLRNPALSSMLECRPGSCRSLVLDQEFPSALERLTA
jgi:hypothetical protein